MTLVNGLSQDTSLSANYQFSTVLDVAETAWIYWSTNHSNASIEIAMQFDNPGWIAIGLSPKFTNYMQQHNKCHVALFSYFCTQIILFCV